MYVSSVPTRERGLGLEGLVGTHEAFVGSHEGLVGAHEAFEPETPLTRWNTRNVHLTPTTTAAAIATTTPTPHVQLSIVRPDPDLLV